MQASDVVEAIVEILTKLTKSIFGGQFSSNELSKDEIPLIEAQIKIFSKRSRRKLPMLQILSY